MVLNRNPDNFFAETEQVAFCTAHIVPGIDFSNDPLLAGRIHSYVDTQISRLGGPNFHEIPINAPVAQVHNNQRDGMHRQAIPRGRVAYEPNSLGGGCPFQAGTRVSCRSREPIEEHKVRGKPEKFAEHYNQATLFWNSQSDVEKAHIIHAFRFELTKVQTVAIRKRMVAGLRNVAEELAQARRGRARDRRCPSRCRKCSRARRGRKSKSSAALSLLARPGEAASRRAASRCWSPTAWTATALTAAARRADGEGRRAALRRREAGPGRRRRRRADRGRDLDRDRAVGALGRSGRTGRRGRASNELSQSATRWSS